MQEEPKSAQKPPYAVRPVLAILGGVAMLVVAIFTFALGGPGR